MGEVVPGLPDGVIEIFMEVCGDGGEGVVGVEGADDRLRRPQVVGLDELHLAHEPGVVVAAERVGGLATDEAAGGFGVEGVGVLDEVADEVVPVGIVEGPLVHERGGVEVWRWTRWGVWGGCRCRIIHLGWAGALAGP